MGGRTATPACGPASPSTRSSASSICRSRRRPRTSTAATGRATICSPRRWCASISRPVSASGISRWCTIRSGITISRRRPIVADITVNGRAVKAVAMPSKQAFLYVLDRVTGQPVWPIEERPMPKGDVPGEWYPPTQPIPTKPPAYSRNYLTVPDDLIDFTPELRAKAIENIKRYKVGPVGMPYNPPDSRLGRRAARRHQHRQPRWRHQLARRRLRSGRSHRLRAGGERRDRRDVGRRAARRVLRHPLRDGGRRRAVHRVRRTGLRQRG